MNKTLQRTKELVFAAILTALSMIIAQFPKINLLVVTATPASHVPTLLAMFISPWVAVMSVVGSVIGFLINPTTAGNFLVPIRAALHIVFALVGMKMIEKKMNIFLVIITTAILHALSEGLAAYALTSVLVANYEGTLLAAAWSAASVTFIHHFVDCIITAPILFALSKAKFIKKPYFMTKKQKSNKQ